eukprot:8130766-Pyramimonas_sp.AAC.1
MDTFRTGHPRTKTLRIREVASRGSGPRGRGYGDVFHTRTGRTVNCIMRCRMPGATIRCSNRSFGGWRVHQT